VVKTDLMAEYMRLEGWKDYCCIEAYQFIPDELDRSVAIRKIEAARTVEDAKAVIAEARGRA
jgi:hypothetical protein